MTAPSTAKRSPYPPPAIPDPLPTEEMAKWRLTEHAEERADERLFTLTEVLVTAVMPEVVYPNGESQYPGTWNRRRGDCRVVVNPRNFEILTVVDENRNQWGVDNSRVRRADEEWARQQAESKSEAPSTVVTSSEKLKALTDRILGGSLKKDGAPHLPKEYQLWLRTVVVPKLKARPNTWARLSIPDGSLIRSVPLGQVLISLNLGVQMQIVNDKVYVQYRPGKE